MLTFKNRAAEPVFLLGEDRAGWEVRQVRKSVGRLGSLVRTLVMVLVCVWPAVASAIDPVTLVLMRMLRDKILLTLADSAVEAALKAPEPERRVLGPPPGVPPPGLEEPERIRFLIDRNFTYLAAPDRDQVYRALTAALHDPANAAVRQQMVDEFTRTAIAVGEAQRMLESLSRSQKQQIATAAGEAFLQMPADERQELLVLLQAGHAPIPPDFNAMLLREMGAR